MKLTETRIKEIIKEEIENFNEAIDPMMLAVGGVTLYAIYKFIFKREPTSEQDLKKVRQYVEELEAKADSMQPPDPPMDPEELVRQSKIKRLQRQYGKKEY